MLTGDTVLGRGTTVVAHPDGAARRLPRLAATGCTRWPRRTRSTTIWPGHGPVIDRRARRRSTSTSRTAASGSSRSARPLSPRCAAAPHPEGARGRRAAPPGRRDRLRRRRPGALGRRRAVRTRPAGLPGGTPPLSGSLMAAFSAAPWWRVERVRDGTLEADVRRSGWSTRACPARATVPRRRSARRKVGRHGDLGAPVDLDLGDGSPTQASRRSAPDAASGSPARATSSASQRERSAVVADRVDLCGGSAYRTAAAHDVSRRPCDRSARLVRAAGRGRAAGGAPLHV